MGKTLSVVIPTYNMEAYLRRCLDSVTRDDVPDTLEVIVVNDGSKDRSLEIAKEYQAKRPDIISIIDKPNGHYGSCINAALKVATGKYFRPLDADDWFDTDALIEFLNELQNADTDLLITAYRCYRKTRYMDITANDVSFNNAYSIENDSILTKQDKSFFAMHSFTYKLDLLRRIKLTLSEGINYTDTEYVYYPLAQVKNFSFLNILLYHYDLTRDGQSMNTTVAARNHNQLATIIERFFSSWHKPNPLERQVLHTFLVSYYYRMLFLSKDDKELKQIDSIISTKDRDLYKSIDKTLAHAPKVWRLLKIHFLWYENLKKIFKIDR